MGLFKKKTDPIDEHARMLKAEIAAVQSQIDKLAASMERTKAQPHVRSTALPPGQSVAAPAPLSGRAARQEPVFERVDHQRITNAAEAANTSAHYNDLGVRKFDLPAVWHRITRLFRRPPPANPHLINFLAAGSLQGLRPLRYENRVARRRVIGLVMVLVALLWGILHQVFKNH
jgi:hypothetical protein